MHTQPHHLALTGRDLRLPPAGVCAQDGKGSAQAAGGDTMSAKRSAPSSGGAAPSAMGCVTFSKGRTVFTMGKATFPKDRATFAAGKAAFSKGRATFAAGKKTFLKGRATFAVGKATCSKAKATFAAGKATFPTGIVLDGGLECPNAALKPCFGVHTCRAPSSRRPKAVVIARAAPRPATGLRPQLLARRLSCSPRGYATPRLLVSESFHPPP
jgi:hypothetical protein